MSRPLDATLGDLAALGVSVSIYASMGDYVVSAGGCAVVSRDLNRAALRLLEMAVDPRWAAQVRS